MRLANKTGTCIKINVSQNRMRIHTTLVPIDLSGQSLPCVYTWKPKQPETICKGENCHAILEQPLVSACDDVRAVYMCQTKLE